MDPMRRALIEKAGYDNNFEHLLPTKTNTVTLASARHRAQVRINPNGDQFELTFSATHADVFVIELARSFPAATQAGTLFFAANRDELTSLLRRAAALAQSLPDQLETEFEQQVRRELARLYDSARPNDAQFNTEVERQVRQRVGQKAFRKAMMDYWDGRCAVTGIALPDVLRASHAKPWAECASDAERLDVFNGFLLSANLDALFDHFLISFSESHQLMIAPSISLLDRQKIGLDPALRLRWMATEHTPYLRYHRARFEVQNG